MRPPAGDAKTSTAAPARRGRPQAPGRSTRRSGYRADIEGLRAVAILGVVLYHADPNLLRGGFVGVDIFFVISGYLITGLLWQELSRARRISFSRFYGRRARRLLPASMLVIGATAVASRLLLPPLSVPSTLKDGEAAALYVANYRFALAQTNYLNASAAPSPYLHYWSLGVEEQFYLLWPLLLLGVSLVWARRRVHSPPPSRIAAVVGLAGICTGSFALSLWLTTANQPWAFFSLPTRAWELGAGGLMALAEPVLLGVGRRLANGLGWLGLATCLACVAFVSPNAPFPGTVALAPVAGAVLAVGFGGRSPNGPIQLLGRAPMKMMGRISYSWYLWHWPMLILAPYALGHPLSVVQALGIAVLSGVVATATFLFVENPLRTSNWLASRPRRSLRAGASLSLAGVALCALVGTTLPSLTGTGAPRHLALRFDRPAPDYTRVHLGEPSPPTTTALEGQIASLDQQIQAQVAASVGINQVPSNLTPSLADAHLDEPVVTVDGCMDSYLDSAVRPCVFGDVGSPTSVVVFGDSHAAMWFPAIDHAGNVNHWQVINWSKATCPPMLLPIISPVLGRTFYECEQWRQNVLQRIAQVHPALVILAMARHYTSIYGFVPYQQPWLSALGQMVADIRAMGSKVAVIGPVPKPPFIVPTCLSAHLQDATACTVSLDQAINLAGQAAEKKVVQAAGGSYIETEPWFCTSSTCAAIVGNIEVWRDDNHITATYAAYLGPVMSDVLEQIMDTPAPAISSPSTARGAQGQAAPVA